MWYSLKDDKLDCLSNLKESEIPESIGMSFRTSFKFDNAIQAAGYFKDNDYEARNDRRYLFNQENFIDYDKFDFNSGVIVIGAYLMECFNGEKYIFETWKICYSEEEINKFEELLEKDYPRYYVNLKDDCLEEEVDKYNKLCEEAENYRMRTVHFEGDIIITDPCYIMREKSLTNDDWDFCDYGSEMEVFNFTNYLTHDTLYGDWSCTTFNSDTEEVIGHFCADAGLVSVFLLDEVLKYNPDFNYHIERPHTTTWIKDFKGDICFEKIDERTLIVKGIGNINFETKQTGL